MSNVDWEFIEMNFPGLVKRIDEFDRKIDAVNRAFERGAGCVTRDPDTWAERVNRYAEDCVAVYEELIVLDPIAFELSYADMALLREARDNAERATPTPEGMAWFLLTSDGLVVGGPFDSEQEALDAPWPPITEALGICALAIELLPIDTEVQS